MSWPASPAWLLELQARFGSMLLTPLDRSTGTLRANTAAYDPALVAAALPMLDFSAAERLAIYHRQYWFRLFTVLQRSYPLTARLLGYWSFNDYAARHLAEQPPRGFDIDAIGVGFDAALARYLPEGGAVLDAARIDAAFHRVTRAPRMQPFRPGPQDAARLATSRFELLPSVALLSERWPLAELRSSLVQQQDDEPIQVPAALETSRHWLLARHQTKLGLVALEPREAQLLTLLQQQPLEQALATLEAAAPDTERATLPDHAQAWLARSVRLGVWAGLQD